MPHDSREVRILAGRLDLATAPCDYCSSTGTLQGKDCVRCEGFGVVWHENPPEEDSPVPFGHTYTAPQVWQKARDKGLII
jgi:hypothetical protein